ncbi:hypothetical protein KDL45_04140 [bacterium]|nr:hypothetical protein [bacterium]MCB9476429.1 hypothetical protein [Deltaproteobacteria bacterium]MCB9478404.1 hypothetical protein [Deltaproteobacteria bacterium]
MSRKIRLWVLGISLLCAAGLAVACASGGDDDDDDDAVADDDADDDTDGADDDDTDELDYELMDIGSPAFINYGDLDDKYTSAAGDGIGVNPPLTWSGEPEGTISFALVSQDGSYAELYETAHIWYWGVFNIPPDIHSLAEAVSPNGALPADAWECYNHDGNMGYMGARYFADEYGEDALEIGEPLFVTYNVYAMDRFVDIPEDDSKRNMDVLWNDIAEARIAEGKITVKFQP